jgi:1-deoxy-D-xylulose-5-phosphate reductoisomerase
MTERHETGAKHILLLGSTGSIGRQALDILETIPGARLVGLAAATGVDLVLEQAARFKVRDVCLSDTKAAAEAAARGPELAVLAGEAGLRELVAGAAANAAAGGASLTVLNGIVGAAGLRATMATLEAGATLALANKESMVAGGPFVLDAARRSGSLILPVDSEHSALFQCLAAGGERAGWGTGGGIGGGGSAPVSAAEELLLTGSGGPFRGRVAADLAAVTPEEALKHPTWSMGPKITIDSATLMNKGLEVIEAHYLFGVPYERITVVISPQSIVHSMARLSDGAILAHMGVPDMRTPIGYALAYPQRPVLPSVRRLDVFGTELTFGKPDTTTFRCLALAEEAGRKAAAFEAKACASAPSSQSAGAPSAGTFAAGTPAPGGPRTVGAPIVLNAANEVAVQAFLDRRIGFLGIAEVVEKCLTWLGDEPVGSLDDVYACDAEARRFAVEAAGAQA